MIRRLIPILLCSAVAVFGSSLARAIQPPGQESCAQDHDVWVGSALKKMESVKPGMNREELLKVFTVEGGLSTRLHRTFVSRECSFFKVDVDFRAVGQPDRDDDLGVDPVEGKRDTIVKISRPYLQFTIAD
jgi:hypothetical protein